MPRYTVEALEKFVVRTTYRNVEAGSEQEAEQLCRDGYVGYDEKEIEEGDEQWLQTLSVEKET